MPRGFLIRPATTFYSYWEYLLTARILDGSQCSRRRGPPPNGRPGDVTVLRCSAFSGRAAATGQLGPSTHAPSSSELSRTFTWLKHWGMTDGAIAKLARKVKPVHLAQSSVSCKLQWLAKELRFSEKEAIRVVESFPPFLTYSVEENLQPFVAVFFERGCSRGDVKRVILENPLVLARRDRSIRSMTYVQETLGLRKSEAVKIFVRRPDLLSLNVDTSLKPILDCLSDLGLTKQAIGSLISKSPFLLTRPLEDLHKHFDRYRGLGLSNEDLGKILAGCPTLMWNDFDKTVGEKLKWLEVGLGFDRKLSLACLIKHPVRFVVSLDTWRDTYLWILSKGVSQEKAQHFFKESFSLFSMRSGGLNGRYAFAKDVLKKTLADVLGCPQYLGARFDLIITRVAFLRSIGVDVEEAPLKAIVLEKSQFSEVYGDDAHFLEYMKWKTLSEQERVHIASKGLWGRMLGQGVC